MGQMDCKMGSKVNSMDNDLRSSHEVPVRPEGVGEHDGVKKVE
jgi:hypothetical protein